MDSLWNCQLVTPITPTGISLTKKERTKKENEKKKCDPCFPLHTLNGSFCAQKDKRGRKRERLSTLRTLSQRKIRRKKRPHRVTLPLILFPLLSLSLTQLNKRDIRQIKKRNFWKNATTTQNVLLHFHNQPPIYFISTETPKQPLHRHFLFNLITFKKPSASIHEHHPHRHLHHAVILTSMIFLSSSTLAPPPKDNLAETIISLSHRENSFSQIGQVIQVTTNFITQNTNSFG